MTSSRTTGRRRIADHQGRVVHRPKANRDDVEPPNQGRVVHRLKPEVFPNATGEADGETGGGTNGPTGETGGGIAGMASDSWKSPPA